MKHVTAMKARILSALAVLGLASGCGDNPDQQASSSGTVKLSASTEKKLAKTFTVTKPGVTTMRLGTQERE
ncbi:MAG: hypothetical protein NTZ90_13445 [Proteobacteria bacterium]|nr:hypothetical protein [Pseudomonadota bacterium]